MARAHRVVALALLLAAPACGRDARGAAPPPVGWVGDPARGKALVTRYGCNTCHSIPGIEGASATVGPPLDRFGRRVYAGGRLNTPEHLVEWIRDPPAVDPRTPMPSVGVTEADARDLAAFLYTLQ